MRSAVVCFLMVLVACQADSRIGDFDLSVDASIVWLDALTEDSDSPRQLSGDTVSGEIVLFLNAEDPVVEVRLRIGTSRRAIRIRETVPSEEGIGDALASAGEGQRGYLLDTRQFQDGVHVGRLQVDYLIDHERVTLPGLIDFEVRNVVPADEQPMLIGAWTAGGPWNGTEHTYGSLERELGFQLDIVHWYMSFATNWLGDLVESAAEGGRLPMITWETHVESLRDIVDGVHDERIVEWARGAVAYGKPIFLRPWQEMNADFFSWGMDPENFVLAWRRLVDIFRREGAYNVRWVWSPNATDDPDVAWNRMEDYYPGSDYVDVLALDGYNWGQCRSWSTWQSFDEVFAAAYERIARLGNQPIWIAEFGTTELGGDKGAWNREALTSSAFPRVEALIYFDENHAASCDWSIRSSTESLRGFISGLRALKGID